MKLKNGEMVTWFSPLLPGNKNAASSLAATKSVVVRSTPKNVRKVIKNIRLCRSGGDFGLKEIDIFARASLKRLKTV